MKHIKRTQKIIEYIEIDERKILKIKNKEIEILKSFITIKDIPDLIEALNNL